MALSPFSVVEELSFDHLAFLLAGLDPLSPRYTSDEDAVMKKWKAVIAEAVLEGRLCPVGDMRVIDPSSGVDEDLEDIKVPLEDFHPYQHRVVANFNKPDVCRWLQEKGIPNAKIPAAIMSSSDEVSGSSVDASQQGELYEVRAMEVLGLLAEALSQQHPGLYAYAGKPNRSQIVGIMSVVVEGYVRPADRKLKPRELNGFGKTTIDNILKASIAEWERRKSN